MTPTVEATDEANHAIADYLDEVRNQLSDIDAEELDELLEDLELHLRQVREDSDDDFETVLGSPAAFAAELRRSAGLADAPAAARRGRLGATEAKLAAHADRVTSAIGSHPWYQATRAFLPELRPAWWVARGYLVVALLAVITTDGSPFGAFPFLRVFGSAPFGTLLAAAAVVQSIRLGRSRQLTRAQGRTAQVVTVLALLGAFVGFASAQSDSPVVYGDEYVYPAQEVQRDFTILPANIHAYDLDGNPLGRVLLYNEIGQPIDLPVSGFSEQTGFEFETTYPTDVAGRPIVNLYPRDMDYLEWGGVDIDQYGNPIERGGPTRVPALPPVVGPAFVLDTETDDIVETEETGGAEPPAEFGTEDVDEDPEVEPDAEPTVLETPEPSTAPTAETKPPVLDLPLDDLSGTDG